jgi:hypothetical protein
VKSYSIWILLSIFFHPKGLFANEVDNISRRWEQSALRDAGPLLDDKVNEQLQNVVKKYNNPVRSTLAKVFAGSEKCDSDRLEKILKEEFYSQHLLGAFELGVESAVKNKKEMSSKGKSLDAHTFDRQNIYRHPDFGKKEHVPSEFYVSAANQKIPLASSVSVSGHYVGTDKFGHFFDQGWAFFNEYKKESEPSLKSKRAMSHTLMTEQGTLGLAGTGVYSFGDLAADLSGGLFWLSATRFEKGAPPSFIKDSSWAKKVWDKGPFFRCENGQVSLIRKFTWSDFVTDAWDEGINCVDFNPIYDVGSLSHPNLFNRNVKQLEKQHPGQRYQCPANPEKCTELKSQYGFYLTSKILSSDCSGVSKARLRFDLKSEACWYARHHKSEQADFNCSDIPKQEPKDAPPVVDESHNQ